MRLDLRKLRFRQPKLVATHLCLLFGSRESRHYVRANTFMGPDPRAELPRTPQSHFFSQFFNWFSRRLYLQAASHSEYLEGDGTIVLQQCTEFPQCRFDAQNRKFSNYS